MRILYILWTLPNTLLGLVLAGASWLCGGRLRLVDGAIEVHGPLPRLLLTHATLVRGGVAALTLGHVVLGQSELLLAQVRRHERVHVRQYEVLGPFFLPAYALASLVAWTRGKDAYRDNRFERAARLGSGEAV